MKWSAGKYSPRAFLRLMASVILCGGGSLANGLARLESSSKSEFEVVDDVSEDNGARKRDGAEEVSEVSDCIEGERVERDDAVEGVVSRKGPFTRFLSWWNTECSSGESMSKSNNPIPWQVTAHPLFSRLFASRNLSPR
jgi:hypothetical protein